MRHHVGKATLSVTGERRMRDSKTVSQLTEKVCKCLARRKRPIYVMRPWLDYIAYSGGLPIEVTLSAIRAGYKFSISVMPRLASDLVWSSMSNVGHN